MQLKLETKKEKKHKLNSWKTETQTGSYSRLHCLNPTFLKQYSQYLKINIFVHENVLFSCTADVDLTLITLGLVDRLNPVQQTFFTAATMTTNCLKMQGQFLHFIRITRATFSALICFICNNCVYETARTITLPRGGCFALHKARVCEMKVIS